MTSIKEVAKAANVSVSVVSKALNNYPDINPDTRERIVKIAEEMNYSPNLAGRNLSSKKQMNIGLISSAVFNTSEKDTNAYQVIKGIYTGIEDNDHELSIFLINSKKQKQKSYTQFCRERNIGGAILQGLRTDDPYFKELVDTNIPCVYIDLITDEKSENIGSISIDNYAAGIEMTDHLLERGHRDIVVIGGVEETFVNTKRLEGARESFRKHGIPLPEESIIHADFDENQAYQEAKKVLKKRQPTAFLCCSDLMAYGVMKAVKETGLDVPEDVSVIGFDDLPFSAITDPPLTTINQNFFDIGNEAAQLLVKVMEKKQSSQHVMVEHELVGRGSVKDLHK
ncbi:LacI family DNA-binding transcriptional regulator [Halobacillus seohaensis]|uniref:LacI family DNA-binding transcriptional regulator n=1 Tax=Halobacillus seohaensis TaxID=447421 RepID=A0ABW2EKX4_9BACI